MPTNTPAASRRKKEKNAASDGMRSFLFRNSKTTEFLAIPRQIWCYVWVSPKLTSHHHWPPHVPLRLLLVAIAWLGNPTFRAMVTGGGKEKMACVAEVFLKFLSQSLAWLTSSSLNRNIKDTSTIMQLSMIADYVGCCQHKTSSVSDMECERVEHPLCNNVAYWGLNSISDLKLCILFL